MSDRWTIEVPGVDPRVCVVDIEGELRIIKVWGQRFNGSVEEMTYHFLRALHIHLRAGWQDPSEWTYPAGAFHDSINHISVMVWKRPPRKLEAR